MTAAARQTPRWPDDARPEVSPIYSRREVAVAAPVASVFAWLSHAERWPEWYSQCGSVTILSGPAPVLGTGSHFRWRVLGVSVETTVEECDPPHRLAWSGTGLGAAAYHSWDLAPTATHPHVGGYVRADAALVIGDPALAIDPAAVGATKIDLGLEWQALTGLPFVYAMWTARPGSLDAEQVLELQRARDRGIREMAEIAREESHGDAAAERRIFEYLRDNLRHTLGEREVAGLERFHELAVELSLAPDRRGVRFVA